MLKPHNAGIHGPLQRERRKMGMPYMQPSANNHTHNATTNYYYKTPSQQKANHNKAETSEQANHTDISERHLNESGEAAKTERPSQPLNTLQMD